MVGTLEACFGGLIMVFATIWMLYVATNTWLDQAVQEIKTHATYESCDQAGREWKKSKNGEYNVYLCKREDYK